MAMSLSGGRVEGRFGLLSIVWITMGIGVATGVGEGSD